MSFKTHWACLDNSEARTSHEDFCQFLFQELETLTYKAAQSTLDLR